MSILILAEHDGQKIKVATRRAVTAAQAWQEPIHLLLAGHEIQTITQEVSQIAGVERVIVVDAAHLAHPLAEDLTNILLGLAHDYNVVMAAHTAFAKNVLPRLAALLDVTMVSDAVEIHAPHTYVRPIYAGNLLATIENQNTVQVVTVRATAFDTIADNGAATVVTMTAPEASKHARWISESRNISEKPELTSARVVVSGGRSLGGQFNTLLDPLADKLGAALGATRASVDAGFAPNDIQIGQTGIVVSPELYIAVGIAGAVQHLAGMKESKIIVAINHDPDAPIFNVADYGLVGDLFEVVPALTAALTAQPAFNN